MEVVITCQKTIIKYFSLFSKLYLVSTMLPIEHSTMFLDNSDYDEEVSNATFGEICDSDLRVSGQIESFDSQSDYL